MLSRNPAMTCMLENEELELNNSWTYKYLRELPVLWGLSFYNFFK